MIEDIIKNNIMVVCWNLDSVKVQGEYILTPEENVKQYVKFAEQMGYDVSHGICPVCYANYQEQLRTRKEE